MNFLKWIRIHWDRAVAVAAVLAGAVALFVGWNGASQTAYPAEQLPYLLSGGLVGLFLFGAGATLWLSADLRDEWGELRGIRDELRANRAPEPEISGPEVSGPEVNGVVSMTSVTELARSQRA